jgi:hypothetical protein
VLADIAEIDNSFDSTLGEILESAIGRLGAAIDMIVYFLKVRDVSVLRASPTMLRSGWLSGKKWWRAAEGWGGVAC